MKILFRLICWAAGIVVLLFVALVVINLFDEDLDPGARAALDRSFTVKDPENGFFVVAGLYAPADRNAHNYGLSLIKRWSREDEKPRKERNYGNDISTSSFAQLVRKVSPNAWCDWNTQQCLSAYAQHAQDIEQAASDGAVLLKRYQNILGYPSYQDYIAGTVDAPMPPYLGVNWAAGVRNAQCALLVQGGHTGACLEMLDQDVRIARKMLAGGRTILGKMIPVMLLNHDYRLLGEILGTDNDAARAYSDRVAGMLEPLSPQELDFSKALLEGFMTAPSLLREVQGFPGGSSTPQPLRLVGKTIGRVFLKYNATLNLDYRLRKLLIEQSRLPAHKYLDELDEYNRKARTIVRRRFNLGMVYNPIGKVMLAVSVPDYPTFLLRTHDLSGLQHLVRMQWQILRQGIMPEQVPAFLRSAGPLALNPYTEQPLNWDAQNHILSFTPKGRQLHVPGGRYEVKL